MSVRILTGDCRDMMATLPDESVHCVVSSPPYWGLRDYGIPASVWGGDAGCSHEWGDERLRGGPGGGQGATSQREGRSSAKIQGRRGDSLGCWCQACGAWRGCLGLEPTPQLFVGHLVEVMRAVRRVLRADGTVWLNLGDTYATGAGSVGDHPGGGKQGGKWKGEITRHRDELRRDPAEDKTRATRDGTHAGKHTAIAAVGPMTQPNRMPIPGLKPKDLVMVPARVAIALQEDGWWLRSDIIWNKLNPMPESTRDRPTKSHEYLFLLSKSEHYYYDNDAIREPLADDTAGRYLRAHNGYSPPGQDEHRGFAAGPRPNRMPVPAGWDFGPGGHGRIHRDGRTMKDLPEGQGNIRAARDRARGRAGISKPEFDEEKWKELDDPMRLTRPPMTMTDREYHPLGRNKRSVWTIATSPFPDAHFATFPPALVEPCILAGTSAKGCCPRCGAGWLRKIEKVFIPQGDVDQAKGERGAGEQKPMDESSNWQGYPRGTVAIKPPRGSGNLERKARPDAPDGTGKNQSGNVPWNPSDVLSHEWHPSCECEGEWFEHLADVAIDKETGKWTWLIAWSWRATAEVSAPVPAVVMDMFGGAGTTALVADRLGRDAVLCEASSKYSAMANKRIAGESPLFAEVHMQIPVV